MVEKSAQQTDTTCEVLQNPLQQISVHECQVLSKLLDDQMRFMLKNLASPANSLLTEAGSSSIKAGSSSMKAGSSSMEPPFSWMEAELASLPLVMPKPAPKTYPLHEPIKINFEKHWYTTYCCLSQQNEQQMVHSLIPFHYDVAWLPLTDHEITVSDLGLDTELEPPRRWLAFVDPEKKPAAPTEKVLSIENTRSMNLLLILTLFFPFVLDDHSPTEQHIPIDSHRLHPSALDLLKQMAEIQHQAFSMMEASEYCPPVPSPYLKSQPRAPDFIPQNRDCINLLQHTNADSNNAGSIAANQHVSSATRSPHAQVQVHNSPNQFGEMSFDLITRPQANTQYQPSSRGSSRPFNAPPVSLLPTFTFSTPNATNSHPDINFDTRSHPLGLLPIGSRLIASPRQLSKLSPSDQVISGEFCDMKKKSK